ncbi:MAG: cytochrome c, partial [Deltaproteobacteria bacterium]|nr:cytochrome c [Deltaproteobacteria bacterium]
MVTKGFQRWSAIIFGSLVMMILVPNIVVAARPSRVNVATVTGEPAPAPTGSVVYESACASCHGNRAQGGAGPALAGHTEEQIVRQVRAPVGEMPMFSPRDVSSYGLEALVEMIEGLDAIE